MYFTLSIQCHFISMERVTFIIICVSIEIKHPFSHSELYTYLLGAQHISGCCLTLVILLIVMGYCISVLSIPYLHSRGIPTVQRIDIYTYIAKTLQPDATSAAIQIADVLCITSTDMHEVLHLCASDSNSYIYTLFTLI